MIVKQVEGRSALVEVVGEHVVPPTSLVCEASGHGALPEQMQPGARGGSHRV